MDKKTENQVDNFLLRMFLESLKDASEKEQKEKDTCTN